MVMVVVYLLRENISSVKLRHAYKQNRREFQNELKPVTHMISSPHLTRTRSNAPFTLRAPQPDSSSQQHKPPLLPLVRTEPHVTSSILSPDAVSHAPRSVNCRYTYHVRKEKIPRLRPPETGWHSSAPAWLRTSTCHRPERLPRTQGTLSTRPLSTRLYAAGART